MVKPDKVEAIGQRKTTGHDVLSQAGGARRLSRGGCCGQVVYGHGAIAKS